MVLSTRLSQMIAVLPRYGMINYCCCISQPKTIIILCYENRWLQTDVLLTLGTNNIIKIKIHSSCEIEDFVETHLCKVCVILRSRALRVACPH